MKIAVDISPIDPNRKSGHIVRGVGKYITLLRDNLPRFDKENEYVFFNNIKEVPNDIDILHFPYFEPFFITLPFIKKVKTVITVHDIVPLMHAKHFPVGIKGNLKWRVQKRLLKRLDAIITDSYASSDDIHEVVGFSKENIHVVYLAADKEFKPLNLSSIDRESIVKKYRLPEKFFLYVGDVTWNKNLPRLISAVKKTDVALVMVGKALTETEFDKKNPWNFDRNVVSKEIKDLDQFKRLGFVSNEDLVMLYNITEALCMPSIDEGFGLPVLEAMQSGCPVIASDCGSLPEVGGDAVLFVDAFNEENIAEALLKIHNNSNLRKELISKGLLQSSKFTLRKMIEETSHIYTSI